MPHLSERDLQLPEGMITQLIQMVSEQKDILSLGAGEPDFSVAPEIVQATKKLAGEVNHYAPPGGQKELKQALVRKLWKENNIHTNSEQVIVTAGSQEALVLSLAAIGDVGEQILVPNPSFLGYEPLIDMLSLQPVPLSLKPEEKWELDPDRVKKAITKKTVGLLINTPNNPTGTVYSKKLLEELADIVRDNNLYLISDEAYEKIIYGKKHISPGSLNGMGKYTITLHTFSKSYAMCGYRLGYCVAPKKIAETIRKTHVYTTISASTLSQKLGPIALKTGAYTRKMMKEYQRRRDYMVKRLNEIGLETLVPDGTFYCFAKISGGSRLFAKNLLKKKKVAVVPGRDFGVYGEGYIRCSFATPMEKIEKALKKIEQFVH